MRASKWLIFSPLLLSSSSAVVVALSDSSPPLAFPGLPRADKALVPRASQKCLFYKVKCGLLCPVKRVDNQIIVCNPSISRDCGCDDDIFDFDDPPLETVCNRLNFNCGVTPESPSCTDLCFGHNGGQSSPPTTMLSGQFSQEPPQSTPPPIPSDGGGLRVGLTSSSDGVGKGGPNPTPIDNSGPLGSTPTTFVTAASTPNSSPTAVSAKSGLPVGAKAGIAVGAVFGVALLGVLAFFLIWRRRKPAPVELAADEGKLEYDQNTSAGMTQEPYADSPGTGTGNSPQGGGYSWGHSPSTEPLAAAMVAQSQSQYNQQANPEVPSRNSAGYWQQQSTTQSPISQNNRQSLMESAPRSSLQDAPSAPPAQPTTYVAYSPAAAAQQQQQQPPPPAPANTPGPTGTRSPVEDWDEDEMRIEAEIAEIERMRQLREERSAMR